jgi:hypothetical protein
MAAALAVPAVASAQNLDVRTVSARAEIVARTSLTVSDTVLRFSQADPSQLPTASVEFTAGARTGRDAQVVLTVEVLESAAAGAVPPVIGFIGEGQGTRQGQLSGDAPGIAARWTGSGIRSGRLVFSLRASDSSTSSFPVRFVISAP